MGEQSRSRGSRRRLAALRWVVLASAACFAGQIDAAGGADSGVKAAASDVPPSVLGSPILTVIVTRHGVRSFRALRTTMTGRRGAKSSQAFSQSAATT
jgi:hypothetical protein